MIDKKHEYMCISDPMHLKFVVIYMMCVLFVFILSYLLKIMLLLLC